MSKPKAGLGKGLVRTLAQGAHPHSSISGSAAPHALQLAPVVSQLGHSYSTSARESVPSFPLPTPPISSARSTASTSSSATWSLPAALSGLIIQPSPCLALLPTWDPPSSSPDSSSSRTPESSNIVQPYRLSKQLKTLRSPAPLNHIRKASYTTASAPARAAVDRSMSLFNSSFLGPIPSGPSLPPSLLVSPSSFSLPAGPSSSSVYDLAGPPPIPPSPKPQLADESHHTVLSPAPLSASDSSRSPGIASHPQLAFPDPGRPVTLPPPGESADSTGLNLYSSSLIFDLGASGLAKERTEPPPPYRERSPTPPPRPRSFPLPEITPPTSLNSIGVGEDAYFVRLDGMCIADGVGGWARSGRGGADAGRWSRLLTHFCEVEVGDWWAGAEGYLAEASDGKEGGMSKWGKIAWSKGRGEDDGEGIEGGRRRKPLDPVEIMQKGFEKCLACVIAEGIHGSSTCLLALLHHSTLLIANLGDCCLLIIRSGEVIFRTSEMQHAFNFPLQVGTHSRDEPMKDARRYDVGVGRGDVVVVGSDGLMDNLARVEFDEDILDTLNEFAPPTPSTSSSSSFKTNPYSHLPTPPSSRSASPASLPAFSPQKVSEALCKRARAISEQTTATTPFMVRAIDEGIDFVGGKKDDISVLVGVIGDRDPGETRGGLALHTE